MSIFGINLKIHWSLIFLLFYVVFVSAVQFPFVLQQSGVSSTSLQWNAWVFGIAFALGLLVSVVLHEMGHVWVAQMQGVSVQGITLMMLGGVSEMGQVPEKPYAELKLAIVGPMVSLVLSFLMAGLYWISIQRAPRISLLAYWLADVNLVLAVFNLIPALPLDGGRVLRSFLAASQGEVKATENSVKVSQVFAWTLGVLGFLELNLFLILIAFFVYHAAQAELVTLVTKRLLHGMVVGEAMSQVEFLSESDTLQQAAAEMMRTRHHVLPVKSEDDRFSILSLDSIRGLGKRTWRSVTVKEVMEPVHRFLDVSDTVVHALKELNETALKELLVKDHGKVVGILKYSDLADVIQFKSLEENSVDSKKAA